MSTYRDLDEFRRELETYVDLRVSEDRSQIATLRRRVGTLETTIDALIHLLVHQHGFDGPALRETAEQFAANKPLSPDNPEPRAPGLVNCALCHRAVPAARTVITGEGVICDPACARR